jgi:hypothetical protein
MTVNANANLCEDAKPIDRDLREEVSAAYAILRVRFGLRCEAETAARAGFIPRKARNADEGLRYDVRCQPY